MKHSDRTFAEVVLYDLGDYKVHTYIAPPSEFGDATHVIELPHRVIVVDTQYSLPRAQEFRHYVDNIGKPLTDIIISHAHPDHYLGLQAFKGTGAQVWATCGVIKAIKEECHHALAQSKQMLGANSATEVIVPNRVLDVDSMTIDGVCFKFVEVRKAEARDQLVIYLPQLKILVVQDLIYNHYHAYLEPHYIHSWIKNLRLLRDKVPEAQLLLVGHGDPTDCSAYDRMIEYLECAYRLYRQCRSASGYKHKLIEAYPSYQGQKLIDVYADKLYAH